MARHWLVRIIVATSLFANALFGWNYYSDNVVEYVFDGDTFGLNNGSRIRLLNIDSPEKDLCGAEEAKKRLEELILGKFVIVKESNFDAFGRRQGLVYQGNQLINETMLKEGWGKVNYMPSSQNEKLKSAYKYAKDNKLGVFGLNCKDVKPEDSDCVIKGNIDENTSKKFYYLPDCRDYDRVKIDLDRGEKFFCIEKEASAAGFVKASGCE